MFRENVKEIEPVYRAAQKEKSPVSLTLIIGNKNYSSWSLRALARDEAGRRWRSTKCASRSHRPDTTAQILRYSPSGRVPCLRRWRACRLGLDGDLRVHQRALRGWHAVAARRSAARSRALGRRRDALGLRRAAHAHADGHPRAADADAAASAARAQVAADVARIHSRSGATAWRRAAGRSCSVDSRSPTRSSHRWSRASAPTPWRLPRRSPRYSDARSCAPGDAAVGRPPRSAEPETIED